MVRPDYGFNYYAYVLKYVDDVMVIHHDVDSVIRRIDKYFKINPSSIVEPDIYLGAKFNKMILGTRYGHRQISQRDMSRNWWQTLRII